MFTAGLGQWLLEESVPVSPWRNMIGEAFVGRYLHALGQYAEWDELIQSVFDVDGATFEAE